MVGTLESMDPVLDYSRSLNDCVSSTPFVDEVIDSPTVAVDKQRDLVLKHVLFFHRHGDRSPVNTEIGTKWKMDNREYSFWEASRATKESLEHLDHIAQVVGPDPTKPRVFDTPAPTDQKALGQLTQLGIDDMHARGAELRTRYMPFFKENGLQHNPYDKVYVESSFLNRTIQSTESLLDGMFPADDQEPQQDSAPQKRTFLIRTMPKNPLAPQHEDQLYNQMESFLKDEMDSLEPRRKAKVDALRRELREVVGIPEPTALPWCALRDVLTCESAHGLPLMNRITNETFAKIQEIDRWLWYFLYNRKDVCQSSFKDGVREVYEHLRYIVTPQDGDDPKLRGQPKVSVFSAHDNSIVALLCALRIMNGQKLPVYGCIVTFEVYEDQHTNEYFIRVLFEGEPVPFAGHEQNVLVPFDFFESRVKEFLEQ